MTTCIGCDKPLTKAELSIKAELCAECTADNPDATEARESMQDAAVDWDKLVEDPGPDLDVDGDQFMVGQRKPAADVYVRYHPDLRTVCFTYEDKKGGDDRESTLYVCVPSLSKNPKITQHFKRTTLLFGVDAFQNYFLWPIRHGRGNKVDARVLSALHIFRRGCEEWVSVLWNDKTKEYMASPAEGDNLPQPVFPEKSRNEWLAAAFGGDQVIQSLDHPIVKRLRGLEL